MSDSSDSSQTELERELQEARLPTDLSKLIGRIYRFECEHGPHHTDLAGTVKAVEVSDEGGLDLYVSSPRFWGERLISIKHNNGTWSAYVDIKPKELSDAAYARMSEEEVDRRTKQDIAARFFEGEFILL